MNNTDKQNKCIHSHVSYYQGGNPSQLYKCDECGKIGNMIELSPSAIPSEHFSQEKKEESHEHNKSILDIKKEMQDYSFEQALVFLGHTDENIKNTWREALPQILHSAANFPEYFEGVVERMSSQYIITKRKQ